MAQIAAGKQLKRVQQEAAQTESRRVSTTPGGTKSIVEELAARRIKKEKRVTRI
jgi:hypothetical protein